MDQKVKIALDKADGLLLKAKEELYKPEEDIVPYSVCQNAYYSIINYLGVFLLEKSIEFEESTNVEDLLTNCRMIDNKFNDLNLTPLYHPTKSKDVWMNLDTSKAFLSMAENTRQIVFND